MPGKQSRQEENPWKTVPLFVDTLHEHRIGPVHVKLKWDTVEILISWQNELAGNPASGDDAPLWHRWACRQKSPVIEFKPVFPDKPVIVKPENPFRIAEDAEVRIYVHVPIWIRIILQGKPPTTLLDIPVVTLSNSWFGGFAEGDLCYWIASGARRTLETVWEQPYLAVCPIRIIDKAPEDLDVQKICLRVANLSLFLKDGQLWSDDTILTYKGMTEISDVHVSGKAPAEAPGAKLISLPREAGKKALSVRTFGSIKGWTGLSMFSK